MNTRYRVGLVYINTNNIGDIVIRDCTKYLIEKSLKAKGVNNYEIVQIDIGEKIAREVEVPVEFKNKQKKRYVSSPEHIKKWKNSKVYYYFHKNELPKIDRLDLLVFAGGGLLKFHQQLFYAYIDEITEIADKRDIPVIFNAVGVEKIVSADPRFKMLQNAINRKCVKAISTRDNLEALNDKYITNKKIRTSRVCDPALWSREAFNIKNVDRKKVGIGVIRPEIFELYDVTLPKEKLLEFYKQLILRIEEKKIDYSFFANGGQRDYDLITEIKNYIGKSDKFLTDHVEKLPQTGKELAEIINTFDRTITCRMHAGIIAYALGVPNISMYWNIKQKYFANLTDQKQNIVYIKDLEKLDKVWAKLVDNPKPIMDEIYKNTDYTYINKYVFSYYKKRYLVKGKRFIKVKKKEIVHRIMK